MFDGRDLAAAPRCPEQKVRRRVTRDFPTLPWGAGRLVGCYALFAGAWILVSDTILGALGAGQRFGTIKGLAFVAVTSVLLWLLLRRREERVAMLGAALAAEEERYRLLFESSGLPMVLVSQRGRILKGNTAAAGLFSPDGADLVGRRITSFVTSDLDTFRSRLESARHDGPVRFEAALASPAAGIVEAVVSAAPIWLAGRTQLLLSFVDETARRRDQRAVEVNRSFLHAILEADPDGIVATDADGRWITWNRRIRSMWNVTDEFVSRAAKTPPRDLEAIPGISLLRDPAPLIASVSRTIEDPDHVVHELVSTIDGKWFEVESHPVYGRELDYLGRAWFARDVTELRRLERDLQDAVARYRAILDSAPLAIITFDLEGRVTSWSKGAELAFGWEAGEAIGQEAGYAGSEFEARLQEIQGFLSPGKDVRGLRITRRAKSGDLLTLRLHAVPLMDGAGARTGALVIMEDVTEREDTARKLADAMSLDPVTDLINRRSFVSALRLLQVEASRTEEQLALIYFDVDNFKGVNEAFGPKAGDRLLREFGELLKGKCRPCDLVARIGGDEFAVLRRHVEDPAEVAEYLHGILAETDGTTFLGDLSHRLTASAGYALFPMDASTPEEFLRAAETANHRAKKKGRSATQAFDARLTTEARRRIEVEAGLRRAIEEGAFVLHYQPQVCLHTGAILGFEGLIRWRHPERGILPPGEFIDIAESTGLIVPMGKWVIREVGRHCRNGGGAAEKRPRFAANLSAAQFADPALVDLVAATIRDNRIPPGLLELELTESMLAADPERAVVVLHALRDLGVSLAIDDFGSGYSSLQYLKRFQADRLKIDRGFVRDIPGDEAGAAIARSIVALGKSLGMRVLAEGIETREQADYLASIGVDEGQGWLFGRPEPPDARGLLPQSPLPVLTT